MTIKDIEKEKRVELHTHTKMSMMDGVIDGSSLVQFVSELGHKAVAITDCSTLQSFPTIYNTALELNKEKEEVDKFKVIYGSEINVIDIEKKVFNLTVLAKNEVGLKNLFKIISIANTKYLYESEEHIILRDELLDLKEGLLIGSGCVNGEVFSKGINSNNDKLKDLMKMYDYIEVYPTSAVTHLIGKECLFQNELEYQNYIKRLIEVAKDAGKIVVATGDVYNLRPEDLIARKIIISQKQGEKVHPLNKKEIDIPNQYFLTTDEMLEAFSFLSEELRKEIVVINSNKIAEQISHLQIIKDDLYLPKIENSKEIIKDMVYKSAKEIYGEILPEIINKRIENELIGIINGGFEVIYLTVAKLVKKSNDDGYFISSRGAVGSSLVAYFLGITKINGLPAHYVCPNCKNSTFEIDGKMLGGLYNSGYDMPNMSCECGSKMTKEGQNIPFETFLGLNAEKLPDIDLNVSFDNKDDIKNYVKELFGEEKVYSLAKILTISKTRAIELVGSYAEENGLILNQMEFERLTSLCTGVKRNTFEHTSGIVVIPQNMDIFDFTPYQFALDSPISNSYITHFNDINNNLLMLDIYGHYYPEMLKYLVDTTNIKIENIEFNDEKVLKLFNSLDTLGVSEEEIMCPIGTLGVTEFDRKFSIKALTEMKPKSFSDLVKISSLFHGNNAWCENGEELIKNNITTLDQIIGSRDDLMISLINYGMESSKAFEISEFVRKGRAEKEEDTWREFANQMSDVNVPKWFIESCKKIKYLFTKANACENAIMSYLFAWFKFYYPLHYYSAFLSITHDEFDVATMLKGKDEVRRKIEELQSKRDIATSKELYIMDNLNVALEMIVRGFTFSNIDIKKSKAKIFVIDEENKTLITPFIAVDGLDESGAYYIVKERDKREFSSIEDFQIRGKVNDAVINNFRELGVFDSMNE